MSGGRLNALLFALLLILAGALVMEVMVLEGWRGEVKEEARRSVTPHEAEPETYWRVPDRLVTVGAITELVERPLFRPSRRPPEPEAPPPEPEPEPEPPPDMNLRLNSTIVTPQGSVAFFRDTEKDEFVRLAIGDAYEGWTLDIIVPEGVVLSARGEIVELRVRPRGAPDSGTAPDPPPLPEPDPEPADDDEAQPDPDADTPENAS